MHGRQGAGHRFISSTGETILGGLLGIDIGFTDNSLARSKYADCARLRRKVAAVYAPATEDGPDELAQYRDFHPYLNLRHLQQEEPSLYQQAQDQGKLLPFDVELPWGERNQERFSDPELRSKLQTYVQNRPSGWIPIERLPPQLRRRLASRATEDSKLSAWYAMPFQEQVEHYCKGCPIRPPNEDNCYLRFSSYPGMNDFREGFLLALLYASTISEERLKQAWFSFSHLDREKGELPKDKIAELYSFIEGAGVNKKPEEFFNRVVQTLENLMPGDMESQTEDINLGGAPFVDEFVTTFLYRDQPYTTEEARKFLPYFETMREVADWAIWDANSAEVRHRFINFRERMNTLVTALQFGDKYDLETFISY